MKDLDSLGLRVRDGALLILDQSRLPHLEEWLPVEGPEVMIEAIAALRLRGAPLIGVAAALSLARSVEDGASETELIRAGGALRAARPTAVNLMKAVDRLLPGGRPLAGEALVAEALAIFEEDVLLCDRIAEHGAQLIEDGDTILTHCNSGGLATAGIGTALGVIRRAHERGKDVHVFVDETRPLLQGSRLTTWELARLGIPHTLICEGMAASLMAAGEVRKLFVGADRIARNGDFANKIGTYSLAVAAAHHAIPFYCAAPCSTIDWECLDGASIPIEERPEEEVLGFGESRWSPEGTLARNPAFDVTPVALLSALVLNLACVDGETLRREGLSPLRS